MTLITGDSVPLRKDGRPSTPSKGLIAVNLAAVWKPLCTDKWNDVSLLISFLPVIDFLQCEINFMGGFSEAILIFMAVKVKIVVVP